jgi:hypothetical protein
MAAPPKDQDTIGFVYLKDFNRRPVVRFNVLLREHVWIILLHLNKRRSMPLGSHDVSPRFGWVLASSNCGGLCGVKVCCYLIVTADDQGVTEFDDLSTQCSCGPKTFSVFLSPTPSDPIHANCL